MTVPESLTAPEMAPVWDAVRRRLERSGVDNRGRLRLPMLAAPARRALAAVLDRPVSSTLDLALLEHGLVRLGVGRDLPAALAAVGEPVSLDPGRRRAARAAATEARRLARALAADWPEEWATDWIDEVIGARLVAGLSPAEAGALVQSVRQVLDSLPGTDAPASGRAELAASVLGSAHALDEGTRLGAATTRALRHALGEPDADVWARAGAHTDQVSAPVLTWGLILRPASALAPLVATANALGVPLHLSQLALRLHRVWPDPGSDVLVVENPRIVEAAAQRKVPFAVVGTNGNPSTAVRLLLDQLLTGGSDVRYHGDFDPGGLAICGRLHRLGIRPWRMDAVDYVAAVEAAVTEGVTLPRSERPAGPTSWDPGLAETFNALRAVVHQERLLDDILGRSDH